MKSWMLLTLILGLFGLSSHAEEWPQDWNQIQEGGKLLQPDGELSTFGFAHGFLLDYNREALSPYSRERLKEWEHYTVISRDFNVAITLASLGFLSYAMVEVVEKKTNLLKTNLFFKIIRKKDLKFPLDPYGRTHFQKGRSFVTFSYDKGIRTAEFHLAKSLFGAQMAGKIRMKQGTFKGISAVSPYRKKGLFFYEYKIPGMKSEGELKVEGKTHQIKEIQGEVPTHAIFDWGRGAWPRHGRWLWGEASGRYEGKEISLNLGHGYEDSSQVSLNALFWQEELHKLGPVEWVEPAAGSPLKDYAPWRLTSRDGRLNLLFSPSFVQDNKINLILYSVHLFKMFGSFSGELVLNDGTKIQVENLQGHLEKMKMKW